MAETVSKRCYYLDLAKVVGVLIVIFAHLYSIDSPVRLYTHGYHMPFFFLVSGIFHRYTGKIDWGRYARTILWPILIFIFLSILTNILFFGAHLGDQLRFYSVDIAKGKINMIIWFLFALFWCKVYMDFFCRFRHKIIPVLIWGCIMFIPVYFFRIRIPFGISQGMMGFPFYALGFLGKDFFLKRRESFKWLVPFVLCLVSTVLITKYLQGRASMLGVNFGDLGGHLFGDAFQGLPTVCRGILRLLNYSLFYLNGLIGSVMILSFSLLPFPKTRLITSLSMSLITVLGTQSIFLNAFLGWLGTDNGYLLSLGLSVVIFFLCYLSHLALKPAYDLVKPKQSK